MRAGCAGWWAQASRLPAPLTGGAVPRLRSGVHRQVERLWYLWVQQAQVAGLVVLMVGLAPARQVVEVITWCVWVWCGVVGFAKRIVSGAGQSSKASRRKAGQAAAQAVSRRSPPCADVVPCIRLQAGP